MPRGGHLRSGSPPDPLALRRDRDQLDWLRLPSDGRKAPPPSWPLSRPTRRELAVWTEEWRRPQAIVWDAQGQQRAVALYVRTLVDAERPTARVTTRVLVRQFMDDLGISVAGMKRHRWALIALGVATLAVVWSVIH